MSWLNINRDSPFSLANIPFGVVSTQDGSPQPAVAIGDHVLSLSVFASQGGFSQLEGFSQSDHGVFDEPTLNSFAALGRPVHRSVRRFLQQVFAKDTPFPDVLKDNAPLRDAALIPISSVRTHLPMKIGDYTDFYAGRNHAVNVGTLFRGSANALQPNYNHLPVGYHGRAGSVVVSGTPVHRPRGQVLPKPADEDKVPAFQPCAKLDLELELGMFVCRGNALGHPIPVGKAEEHIFGYVLMNDWSARDIQAWEYVPLGPFNSKNFATTISPWVVLADVLDSSRTKGLTNDVDLVPYLREKREDNVLDISLEVSLKTASGSESVITRTSSKNLLWSWPQMIAHHSVTGCNLNTGDLLGSGTVSGPDDGLHGSLLEQTRGRKTAVQLSGGEERRFLKDGDSVVIRGWTGSEEDGLVGFGSCEGKVLEALPYA